MRQEQEGKTSIPEYRRRFLEEVVLSYSAVMNTFDQGVKTIKDEVIPFHREAHKAFSNYAEFIEPLLLKVYGAVFLEDNQVQEVTHKKVQPVRTKHLGTLFKNWEHIFYPTRTYFLPESLEIVSFVVKDRAEFPENNLEFRGWEDYRKYWPDNFQKVIDPVNVEISPGRPYGYRDQVIETMKALESRTVEDEGYDELQLVESRSAVEKALKTEISETEVSKSKQGIKVRQRIEQLLDVLEGENMAKSKLFGAKIDIGYVGDPSKNPDLKYIFLPNKRKLVVGKLLRGIFLRVEREASYEKWFEKAWTIANELIFQATGSDVGRIRKFLRQTTDFNTNQS